MSIKKYFVTGTDTEVGKTYVSALICKYFIAKGKKVGVFKPVESGMENNPEPDFKILAKAAQDREKPFYTFKKPLAPFIAAMLEGGSIKIEKILEFITEDIERNDYDIYIVEGAGGLFVPVSKNAMMIDILEMTGFKAILVGRTNLGTVNHTLMSVEALRRRGVDISSVILNEVIETDSKEIKDNIKMIEQFGNIKVDAVVRRNETEIRTNI